MYVPDNLDIYDSHEKEQTRKWRVHKKLESEGWVDRIEDLPFYPDDEGEE